MRRDFKPLVYKVYGMAGRDTRAAEKRLEKLLKEKWQRGILKDLRICPSADVPSGVQFKYIDAQGTAR